MVGLKQLLYALALLGLCFLPPVLKQHVLQHAIQIGVIFRDSLVEGLFDSVEILFKQFRDNDKILVLKPYAIDRKVLLAQHRHQLVTIRQYKLVLELTNQSILLCGTCQVVRPRTHLQKSRRLVKQLNQ